MNKEEIISALKEKDIPTDDIFKVTRAAAYKYQNGELEDTESLDLIIRLIDRRDEFEEKLPGIGKMINAIAREAGLYPYITNTNNWREMYALNLSKAPGLSDIIFHIEQASVFQKLASGKSVILSAPTSFGKSLLIDALISFRAPKIVVAVVPTIALLDEFRRRMARKFPDYDIITTSSEGVRDKKTIFIGTQERLLERDDIPEIDLFVIDEFYKLDLERSDERSLALNAILAKYGTKSKQIYFLGPSINEVPNANRFRTDLEFIRTRYSPVTADIVDRTDSPPSAERLIDDLEKTRHESSLIYVRSPRAAWELASTLNNTDIYKSSSFCRDLGNWLGEEFHPEWILAHCIKKGIGIHHGRVPRAIAYLVISLFNKQEISGIICTSSMIEGVNTAAENVFIYDRHISTSKLDRFTFDNIKGRAGRMFRHKIGKVYLYNPPPEDIHYDVRVPLFEEDDRIVPELLVQIDDTALTPFARQRKRAITASSSLPPEILQRWATFGVEALGNLSDFLADELEDGSSQLYWKGVPTFEQLEGTFEAVWGILRFPKHGIRSPRQLAYFANSLRLSGSIREFMNRFVRGKGLQAQRDIDLCFNFIRGSEYTFPQVIRALNDVIDSILGEGAIDYRVFAQQLQSLFMAPGTRTLDEFGIPIPLARKLQISDAEDISGTLHELSGGSAAARSNLSSFENEILNRGLSLE